MADSIQSIQMKELLEEQYIYTAEAIDSLLQREREAAIERENALSEKISENDDCFDDMVTALNDLVDLEDIEDSEFTIRDVKNRVNLLTHALQTLREGIMD